MPFDPSTLPLTERVRIFFRRRRRRFRNRVLSIREFLNETVSRIPFLRRDDSVPADKARCLRGEVIGSYKMISEINKGTFGAVYRCQHTETGKRFAAKYYSLDWIRSADGKCMTETEMHVMRLLQHRNTVSLQEILFMKDGLLIVMELVEGRNLVEILPSKGGIMEPFARQIFGQFLDGLEYLHKRRIVHRDIKLENVMIDHHGNVKIIDYGLAEYVRRTDRNKGSLMVHMECGSLNYLAPEIISSHGGYFHGNLADIWAAGILLYVMVVGHFPFDHDNDEKLKDIIHSADEWLEEALDEADDMSTGLKDFLRKILVKDPKKRPSIAEMKAHPWMRGKRMLKLKHPAKTFSNPAGKFAITFHDTKPERSLTSAKNYRKKRLLERRLLQGRGNRTVPLGFLYGAQKQSDSESSPSSKATSARRMNWRRLPKQLARIFRSAERNAPSIN